MYNEGVNSSQSGKFNEAIIAYDEALKINLSYVERGIIKDFLSGN